MTSRPRGLRARPSTHRDARLFIIATEGEKSEPAYFEALDRLGIVDADRFLLVILRSTEGNSAPTHVVDRLSQEASKHQLMPLDEKWVVVDTDRWQTNLVEASQLATQRGIQLAVSNPCWEVWLLQHLDAPPVPLPTACNECERSLRVLLGGYSKQDAPAGLITSESVARATGRCRRISAVDRWPQSPGSHVGELLAALRVG